jgi:hypothetical protein
MTVATAKSGDGKLNFLNVFKGRFLYRFKSPFDAFPSEEAQKLPAKQAPPSDTTIYIKEI